MTGVQTCALPILSGGRDGQETPAGNEKGKEGRLAGRLTPQLVSPQDPRGREKIEIGQGGKLSQA